MAAYKELQKKCEAATKEANILFQKMLQLRVELQTMAKGLKDGE